MSSTSSIAGFVVACPRLDGLWRSAALTTRMEFHWWWILVAFATFWIPGWLVAVIVGVFFNPLDSEEDKRKNFRGRLLAQAAINWVLWPGLLSALLERRKLYRDMRTGKRPSWIIRARGEHSGRQWTLSDGTEFGASVSGGSSSEVSHISADYEDDELTGEIEYRTRMVAPTSGAPTAWLRLEFAPRGPEPDPDDEDAVDDYTASRYEVSVQMPRGKHEVEFRVRNRSGRVDECSALILIVAEPDDYIL